MTLKTHIHIEIDLVSGTETPYFAEVIITGIKTVGKRGQAFAIQKETREKAVEDCLEYCKQNNLPEPTLF